MFVMCSSCSGGAISCRDLPKNASVESELWLVEQPTATTGGQVGPVK
jgi:hypothetical protein